jgi:hypothetical protein
MREGGANGVEAGAGGERVVAAAVREFADGGGVASSEASAGRCKNAWRILKWAQTWC